MRETEIAPEPCPFCQHPLDRVTAGPENPDATPREGDFTLCIQCGGVLVFNADLRVRPPSPAELVDALGMPETVRIIEAIAKAHGGTHGQHS